MESKIINNTESKNLTDILNENKIDIKEINENFEIKNQNININENIVNNGKNNNNNYIISNISGTINYIPPEKIILEKKFKKLNKTYENLKMVNNTFSINSVKSEKVKEKDKGKEKEKKKDKRNIKLDEEDFIKSISINLLEEENQKRSESFSSSYSNEKDIKIE